MKSHKIPAAIIVALITLSGVIFSTIYNKEIVKPITTSHRHTSMTSERDKKRRGITGLLSASRVGQLLHE